MIRKVMMTTAVSESPSGTKRTTKHVTTWTGNGELIVFFFGVMIETGYIPLVLFRHSFSDVIATLNASLLRSGLCYQNVLT